MMGVRDIIPGARRPLRDLATCAGLDLGESLASNAAVRRMLFQNGALRMSPSGKRPAAAVMDMPQNVRLDRFTRFALFVVMFNQCFDLRLNKVTSGLRTRLRQTARELRISDQDFKLISDFFSMQAPYLDTSGAVYQTPEHANQLFRAGGVHVYFTHPQADEVRYFKYVEDYDLLLSRTYTLVHPNSSFPDSVSTRRIDVLNRDWYNRLTTGLPAFARLKSAIRAFDPLQRVAVAEDYSTPRILLDPARSIIIMAGASAPISASTYFEPILHWLHLLEQTRRRKLRIYLRFKYFNAYTAKFLLSLVKRSNAVVRNGKTVEFYWYHEKQETEMKEFGEHLRRRFIDPDRFAILESKNKL